MVNVWRTVNMLALASVVSIGACGGSGVVNCARCLNHVALTIKAPHWEVGHYTLDIDESGRTFRCSFEVGAPGSGGQAGQGSAPNGTTDQGLSVPCEQTAGTAVEDPLLPRVTLAKQLQADILGTLDELEFTLDFSGQRLLDEKLEPAPPPSFPNGGGCPACIDIQAEYSVQVPTEG